VTNKLGVYYFTLPIQCFHEKIEHEIKAHQENVLVAMYIIEQVNISIQVTEGCNKSDFVHNIFYLIRIGNWVDTKIKNSRIDTLMVDHYSSVKNK
jgi:hypothetical protein